MIGSMAQILLCAYTVVMRVGWVAVALVGLVWGCGPTLQRTPKVLSASETPPGMVWIVGGSFTMGADDGRADENPTHEVSLNGFWMDVHEVTNDQFAEFVKATGYVTVAERKPTAEEFPGASEELLVPGSLVFHTPRPDEEQLGYLSWWAYVPGANWRHPLGPDSSLDTLGKHPVVHIAWEDAMAYAKWADKALPTEAQWEFAARGGRAGVPYAWGDTLEDGGASQGNIWQGRFPRRNSLEDGFERTAPVKSFPPNPFGLYDMGGNVWEWCLDWYHPDGYASASSRNPAGPESSEDPDEPGVPKRVVRGGSFLCNASYCAGYRVSARMKSSPDTGLSHTGFRCVRNKDNP